ncbi:NUDIX domain-containing protein [Nonomuraea phyllanthi]|uniref:NUDIX domain-containing protein n=1 Tax=Nonomuraea phyllanthi TaxID=2219224 RepID=A0A5C4VT89_9ACTN|nr:NUDIX hydrolase [Nonomuraea phyllanthi]KAB8189979.1 NUDIX domain-containing protein [Nonomuraea phyllanthi]QFY08471.1 NUDIX domain-containing protein [Nonomuraea phyllanthi]
MRIEDTPEAWDVVESRERFRGHVITVVTDTVKMPRDEVADRDYVVHPGAVAVLALDDQDRVLMIRQYRHPARQLMWELPAGIRDVEGESLVAGAARELAEEAGYRAETWHTLIDLRSSPGMSDERIRVFLARDLTKVETGFVHRHEEIDMPVEWVPLPDAVERALMGMIHNSPAVAGILAAYAASVEGFALLRPADAPEA